MDSRINGTLKNWNEDKGFGFIAPVSGGQGIFVHISDYPKRGGQPKVGESLSFEVAFNKDGKKKAVRVQRPGMEAEAPYRPRHRTPARHEKSVFGRIVIRDNDEMKGLVNAGHTRANAYVGRTVAVGDGHEPKMFDVWSAKAFAGIALERHLPPATMSRGIVISLRRKMPTETVSRLRHADRKAFTELAAKLARFSDDYSQQVRLARPDLPDELGDRDQDNWEPLLAIAECAGPAWVKRATEAALVLSRKNEESVSTGNELLSDIQYVFESKGVDRISTVDLITALIADDEKPWATYNRGKPLSPRQLSKQLAAYNIKTKTVRFGHATPKGFELSQFEDVFARYLSAPQPVTPQRNETPESSNGRAGGDADRTQQVRDEIDTLLPMPALECGGVAAVAAPPERDAEKPSVGERANAF